MTRAMSKPGFTKYDYAAMQALRERLPEDPRARLLLLDLIGEADRDTGMVRGSYRYLSEKLGMHLGTFNKCRKVLEAVGEVRTTPATKDGRTETTILVVDYDYFTGVTTTSAFDVRSPRPAAIVVDGMFADDEFVMPRWRRVLRVLVDVSPSWLPHPEIRRRTYIDNRRRQLTDEVMIEALERLVMLGWVEYQSDGSYRATEGGIRALAELAETDWRRDPATDELVATDADGEPIELPEGQQR
jgi:hypothetical protein